ncbi:MAG: DUF2179 domain-containing protein [Bellilinea sp.]
MPEWLTVSTLLITLSIFFLRVIDMSLDTIRVLFVVRGRKLLAWVLGFFQSAVFIIAISSVLTNDQNVMTIVGYAAGFATGNVVGMLIEERLAIGHIHLTIVSPARGVAIAEMLREHGYAVTELSARGLNGMVSLLHVDVMRRQLDVVDKLVRETDGEAFITAEDVRPVRRGFWRA